MRALATFLFGAPVAALVAATVGAAPAPVAAGPAAEKPAMVDAIVVLRAQAAPGSFTGRTRAARLRSAVETLQGVAVAGQRGLLRELAARSRAGTVTRVDPLWVQDAISVRATPAVLATIAARGDVAAVEPDRSIAQPATLGAGDPPAEGNLARIGAPALWNLGFRGQGVVVASMDTGVDVTAPDLAAHWRGGGNSWFDPYGEHPAVPTDVNGHGTQAMSVAVGGSAGGTAIGVAPEARWIAAKIFDDRGRATSTGIHQAFQWLLDPDHDATTPDAPHVVNDSWVSDTAGCALDFAPDIAALRGAGILSVFAAGNGGPGAGTVASPGNNPAALAVGGVDSVDAPDPASARGPSACTGAVAPDLVAPDTGVRAADLYGGYVSDTGTSVAAPHVSGALALLLSALPSLAASADTQQSALEHGAVDLGATGVDPDFGNGRLDIASAYAWAAAARDFSVTASPAAVTTPPGGTVTSAVAVTSAGGFGDDVALSLGSVPAGVTASVSPAVVTGSGSAQLTATVGAGVTPGTYALTVVAQSGAISHTTAVTLTVTPPPGFTVSATPTSRSVNAGATTTYALSVGALNGFSADVALGVAGVPAAVGTATMSPAVVHGAGTATLTVTTLTTAPGGSVPIAVSGTSGGVTHTVGVTLSVTARALTLTASPVSASVTRGSVATYTLSLKGSAGFTGPVTLAAAGAPAGTTLTWSANPAGVPSSPTLRVSTTQATPRGTFSITITGTSSVPTKQVTVALTVR